MKNKKILLVAIFTLIILIGGTYAWFNIVLKGDKKVVLTTGKLSLELDESLSDGIKLLNAYPVKDVDGLKNDPYTFSLKNTGNMDSTYMVYLDDIDLDESKTRMKDEFLKYNLEKTLYDKDNNIKDSKVVTDNLSILGTNPNRIVDSGTLEEGERIEYSLKLWMDYDTPNEGQDSVFSAKLRIEGNQIIE